MKKGFTLSEVLITLGIVGVVAVLTVPGVMKNYKNRLYTSQLQKVYSQISEATQAMMNDQHVDNIYETTIASANSCSNATKGICEKGVGLFLNNYFKSVKRNCGNGGTADKACVATTYTTIDSGTGGSVDAEYCIQNTNGAAICAKWQDSMVNLIVDVNGPASPNMIGRDVFAMDIKSDGTIVDYNAANRSKDPTVATAKKACNGSGSTLNSRASGCLNAIIDAGWKMNY